MGVVRVTLDPTITLSIRIYIGFLVKKAHFSPSGGYFFVPLVTFCSIGLSVGVGGLEWVAMYFGQPLGLVKSHIGLYHPNYKDLYMIFGENCPF